MTPELFYYRDILHCVLDRACVVTVVMQAASLSLYLPSSNMSMNVKTKQSPSPLSAGLTQSTNISASRRTD